MDELIAGPLTATLDDGALRWVRFHGHEVVRGIYAAVRDDVWGTVPGVIEDLRVSASGGRFVVTFVSTHVDGDIDVTWHATVTGDETTLVYAFDGLARSTFDANRIGLCVLHPPSVAGWPVEIGHGAGADVADRFPQLISPSSPFTEVTSMQWPTGGVMLRLDLTGDLFETEDQRNWGDASFKTFCRPLAAPHPYAVSAGTRIRQQARLTVSAAEGPRRAERPRAADGPRSAPARTAIPARPSRPEDLVRVFATPPVDLPDLGTALAAGRERLDEPTLTALRPLRLGFLRCVVRLTDPGWPERLDEAIGSAQALDTRLEVEAVLDDRHSSLAELAAVVGRASSVVSRVLAFPRTGYATTASAYRAVLDALPERGGPAIDGGSRAHFAELNRCPPPEGLERVTFPFSPQVHAFDTATVMESLEVVPDLVQTALDLGRGRPLSVGPLTLRPRFNAYAASAASLEPAPDALRRDDRQEGRIGATWTVAMLSRLCRPEVASVVLHEATGPAGLVGPAGPTATLQALSEVRAVGPSGYLRADGPADLAVLALRTAGSLSIVVSNPTARRRQVRVQDQRVDAWVESGGIDLDPYAWGTLTVTPRQGVAP